MSVAKKKAKEEKPETASRSLRASDDTWDAWLIWLRARKMTPEKALLEQMREHPINESDLPQALGFKKQTKKP